MHPMRCLLVLILGTVALSVSTVPPPPAAAGGGGGGGGGEVISINDKKINGINSAVYSRRHAPRCGTRTMLGHRGDGISAKLIMNVLKRNGQRKKWSDGIRGGSAEIGSNTLNQSLSGKVASAFGLEGKELPKFGAMSAMMFFIIYIFTMTRDTKDVLIVTNCGAEAIAFLKVYGVIPAATLFLLGYNVLSNKVSKRALFRLTIIPFMLFYLLFGLVLYPLRDVIQLPPITVEGGASSLINICRLWSFSLYYIISELWGSAGIPLLFWTCANDVTPMNQAKRMYSLFGLLGNLGPIASGQTMVAVRNWLTINRGLSDEKAFESSIKVLTYFMTGAGAIIVMLYEMIQNQHERDLAKDIKKIDELAMSKPKKKKEKLKMGIVEGYRYLASSSYLRSMTLMVLGYGLIMEFTEISWKAVVRLAFPDKTDYLGFMGMYSRIVGVASFLMLLCGKELIKRFGWKFGAMVTPVVMATLSLPFFGILTFCNLNTSSKALTRALYVGMLGNILSKACKYSVFDPTKEMAYIPLDENSKVQGKAAIDVLGARLGKSSSALSQQALVLLLGTILSAAPVLALLVGFVAVIWIRAVSHLGGQFQDRMKAMEGDLSSN